MIESKECVKEKIEILLEYLSSALSVERQAGIDHLYMQALNWLPVKRLPLILNYPLDKDCRFQPYPHSEIYSCPEKMLFNELVYSFGTSIACRDSLNDDLPCTIRANFGTVVIASMFGAHVEQHENNPPWVLHDLSHDLTLEQVLNKDPLDFSNSWISQIIERYKFYRETLIKYPNLNQVIRVVLPDLQSPFDNLEQITGSGIFLEIKERPGMVSSALEVMASAQIGLAKHLMPYINDGAKGISHQHATAIRGNILLRNDSVIMMSPEMYDEIVAPHDERILRELGGGGIHCCGKIERHAENFLRLPSCRCLDLGQPELNDVATIYKTAQENSIPLIRVKATEKELVSGQIMDLYPTGVSLICNACSITDARRIMDLYLKTTGC